VRRGNLSPGQRARLLLADALRWERSGDKDRFRSRLTEAREIAADSAEGRVAEARLLLADVRGLGDLDRLPDMLTRLNALVIDGGEEGAMVRPVLDVLSRLGRDSQGPTADLEEFLMAETVRDSLRANALAASLFRKLQRDFPRSPLAAKALLAVAVLTPDSAAVIAAMVDSAYPDSPYRLAIRMNDTVAYPALEDSLRLLLDSARRAQADRVQGMMRRPTAGRDSTVSRPATGRRLPEP
jgi:hypothetical protein